jgi:hypothetical protein
MLPSPIARAAALAVACAALAGCSSNHKGKIEGTKWSCLDQLVKGSHVDAGTITIEFKKDGSLVLVNGPTTITGKYSLGASDTVKLSLDQAFDGKKHHEKTMLINGDDLQMIDPDGNTIRFRKAT